MTADDSTPEHPDFEKRKARWKREEEERRAELARLSPAERLAQIEAGERLWADLKAGKIK